MPNISRSEQIGKHLAEGHFAEKYINWDFVEIGSYGSHGNWRNVKAGNDVAFKNWTNQWWHDLLTHSLATRFQWVKHSRGLFINLPGLCSDYFIVIKTQLLHYATLWVRYARYSGHKVQCPIQTTVVPLFSDDLIGCTKLADENHLEIHFFGQYTRAVRVQFSKTKYS